MGRGRGQPNAGDGLAIGLGPARSWGFARALALVPAFVATLVTGSSAGSATHPEHRIPPGPATLADPASGLHLVRRGAPLLEEGFEGAGFPPAGWTRLLGGAVPPELSWNETTDPVEVRVGSKAAVVHEQSGAIQDEKLVAKKLDLVGMPSTDLSLVFWYHTDPFFADPLLAFFQVHASADSAAWTELFSTVNVTGTGWAWRQVYLDLSAWAGGNLWLRFRYRGHDGADLALDDVWVGYAAPPAPPANDDCAGANADAQFHLGPATGPFALAGNNLLAANDYPLPAAGTSCTGWTCTGRDLAWRVQLPAEHRITATMSTLGGWDDTLFLVSDCSTPSDSCVAGDRQIPDGSTITWDNTGPSERTLWLIASAWAGGAGEFTIDGTIEPIISVTPMSWGRLKARYYPAGREGDD